MRSNWAAGWTLLVTVPERFGSKLDTKAVLPYRFRFEHLNGNHYHMSTRRADDSIATTDRLRAPEQAVAIRFAPHSTLSDLRVCRDHRG